VRRQLEQVYEQYRQGLFSLALAVTGNETEAEDAVHDAFLKLVRHGQSPRGDLTPYVFATVRNAAMDRVRRRIRRPEARHTVLADTRETQPPSEQALLKGERDRLIRNALDNLPELQQQTVVMKMYGNLTFQQIADALDEPLSTVSSRYQRALKALRHSLEELL